MKKIRVAVIGCEFWSRYQTQAWGKHEGVEIVGLCNRTKSKAEELSALLGGVPVFDSAKGLLEKNRPDTADIITGEETHREYALLAASLGINVISQKPMAPAWEDCAQMAKACDEAGVKLFVHDNWRWQAPIAAYREQLRKKAVGPLHRGRVTYANSFPVFDNQPFLADLDRFILMDMGTHLFDTARSLYGEAKTLTCLTQRVNPGIKGEDVATVMAEMESGMHLTVEMSYSSPVEQDDFPYTRIHTEGRWGSLELAPDWWIKETVTKRWERNVTRSFRVAKPRRKWIDPAYVLSTSSCEPAIGDILADLRGQSVSGLRGRSYLNTMLWVFAAYESAARGVTINLEEYKRSLT